MPSQPSVTSSPYPSPPSVDTPDRAARSFWRAYLRSWQGMAGLGFIIVFIVLAIGAPYLTPYDPLRDQELASTMAMPSWMRYFQAYRNFPVTQEVKLWAEASESIEHTSFRLEQGKRGDEVITSVSTIRSATAGVDEPVELVLRQSFDYLSAPPHTLIITLPYAYRGDPGVVGRAQLQLHTADGKTYVLWESPLLQNEVSWREQRIDSRDRPLAVRLGFNFFTNMAKELFAEKGTYVLTLRLEFDGVAEEGSGTFLLGESQLRIPGDLHGPLGADHIGGDLWAQWLYGARTSLLVGFTAALIAVGIGTLVGVVSGYWGGWVDELFMRLADVMLSIPLLPIMIVVAATVGKSIVHIVFLLALFSWMGTARLVRSATLALRQQTFVEAARAAGATRVYIVSKHILPQMFGLIIASLILLVPGAIIAEATLSFLGMGDPQIATWGRMLHNARSFGAFAELAWWWILPPGMAITLLSVSLMWIGNTVDDIFQRRTSRTTMGAAGRRLPVGRTAG